MALDPNEDVVAYLKAHEQKELLRFVAVGSVDDGKSTLIGRLLHDTHGIYEDQLAAVKRASIKGQTRGEVAASEIDFSLFTDGLKAEREQGITIDVAYRYFSTDTRKFIIADTPGHVQYTRNMATGASTANVAIILIDARLGILPQSRRHAYIASLLGIPHLLVCVNKMDLRGFDRAVFESIREEFGAFAGKLSFKDVRFLPISALGGDNVVHRSERTPWWSGETVLSTLESIPIAEDRNLQDFRYPVQYVIRPDLAYRGYASQVASGAVKVGDEVMVLPSKKRSKVVSIDTFEGPIDAAFAPMSVSLRLADEIDVSRGDMIVHPSNLPRVGKRFEATVVWMNERPLDPERSYLLKHTTQMVRARVERVQSVTDPETLEPRPAEKLSLNEIGRVTLETQRALFFDPYEKNRSTGAFILVDSITNETVGAGMILEPVLESQARASESTARGQVSAAERRERLGQSGATVALAAPTLEEARSLAWLVERQLFDLGRVATVTEEASAQACARAGLVAVVPVVGPSAGVVRVGEREARVAVGEDPERAASAVVAALESLGAFV
ncbi:MAG: sulfate adenylyltransferase subunit CysN [Polyangiales bacterium]